MSTVNLEVSTLDGVAVNDTLTPELVANNTEKVNFKNIIIKGNLTCNLESLEFINGVNITHLLETAIYIDEPQNIKKMHFKNVTGEFYFIFPICTSIYIYNFSERSMGNKT